MKRWRNPEDVAFTDIPNEEWEAACLWELLRQLPPKQLKNLGGAYGAKAKRILAELLNFNSLSSSWKSNPNSIPKPKPALSILDRTAVANPALGSPRDSPTRRIGNNG